MRDRYLAVRNAQQLAREASEEFGMTIEAARKRIDRSDWYKNTPGPSVPPRIKRADPPPSPAPAVCQQRLLLDRVKRALANGDALQTGELATKLDVDFELLERFLIEHKEAVYRLGSGHWRLCM